MTQLPQLAPETIEKLVLKGDLSGLNNTERVAYYNLICHRVGVDPAMQPFKLLNLSGKQTLYLDRSGAQQLNQLHKVSHAITSREMIPDAGVYQVTARATLPDSRYTESIGAVNIAGLKGEAYANAIMKAETKAKRRSTLDLLGLGMLDETEVETIPGAKVEEVIKPAHVTQPTIFSDKIGAEIPEPYKQRQNDADYIIQLINAAPNTASLRLLHNINTAFFVSNPEVNKILMAKGMELKQSEQPKN